jgi:hypothetical protein
MPAKKKSLTNEKSPSPKVKTTKNLVEKSPSSKSNTPITQVDKKSSPKAKKTKISIEKNPGSTANTPIVNVRKSPFPVAKTTKNEIKKSPSSTINTPIAHIEKTPSPDAREPMSHFVTRQEKTVFIHINVEKIKQIALDISQQPLSWDDINWLISESELKIANAIVSDENPLKGPITKQVKIDRTQIIEKPNENHIRELAQNIANKQESLEQRYFDLALRQYIFDLVKI